MERRGRMKIFSPSPPFSPLPTGRQASRERVIYDLVLKP
jgi:hypothetical protein